MLRFSSGSSAALPTTEVHRYSPSDFNESSINGMKVRVRFAPSPTGFLHIGGYRTALFDWLYARHTGGTFILRIEDTDIARTVEGSVEFLIEGMKWLGMDYDEGPVVGGPFGPYYETQRKAIYQYYTDQLIASGHAYRCYCTPERLKQMRAGQEAQKLPPRYDRLCRYLTPQERAANERSEEHTSELQSQSNLVCRLLL